MASTNYEQGFFSTRNMGGAESLNFRRVAVTNVEEELDLKFPQSAWKSSIMSNSGISREPERTRMKCKIS